MKEKTAEEEISLLNKIEELLDKQSLATKGLFVLALFYTLYFARELLLPILFAFIFYFLLHPFVNLLKKHLYIPKYLGSALVLLILFFILGFGFAYISAQSREWLETMPKLISIVDKKIDTLAFLFRRPIQIFSEISDLLNRSFNLTTGNSASQSWTGIVFTSTWQFLIATSMSIAILYFLLASEHFFLNKVIKFFARTSQKKSEVIVREIELLVWKYLVTRTAINLAMGISVSLLLYLLEVPNPILWGLMVGILEFIPFIGAAISIAAITFVSFVSFDNIWHILSVPFFLTILLIVEGHFIAPFIMGESLVLNKVSVVLGVFLFGWLWGFWGAFLAIPLMTTSKIIIDHISKEEATGELLEE